MKRSNWMRICGVKRSWRRLMNRMLCRTNLRLLIASCKKRWNKSINNYNDLSIGLTQIVILLTLETTCDETAAAVVTDQLQVLSSVVASQDQLHERFHGVVPEIAARAH